ncbi:PaaI family thioesterase [Rhodococcus sp. 077-4]|uniref:PaaI family thioesterase n=1 Tax=Rhodococcus sp. 077-4 TaxID=2789271 RepID=UPI0039F4B7CC
MRESAELDRTEFDIQETAVDRTVPPETAPNSPSRTRTVSWADPTATAAGARGRSGREFLTAMQSGELPPPPVMTLTGTELVEIGDGFAAFALHPAEYHYNPIGSVHGGIVAMLLDSAAGAAVQTTLPDGVGYTSLDLSIKYLRAVRADTGLVTATGTVVHSGRRTALAHAELRDVGGRLLAQATSSCVILRPE